MSRKESLLAFEKVLNAASKAEAASNKHSIFFLHGLLGSKRNWISPARDFIKAMPGFVGVNIDLPGHGMSPTPQPATVPQCAEELRSLFTSKTFQASVGLHTDHHRAHHLHDTHTHAPAALPACTPTVLVGHSFGGRVALQYLQMALQRGWPVPLVTFILDSLPHAYVQSSGEHLGMANSSGKHAGHGQVTHEDAKHHYFHDTISHTSTPTLATPAVKYQFQSVKDILDILATCPKKFANRQEALAFLSQKGIDGGIGSWLATSLVSLPEGGVAFVYDIPYIQSLFSDFSMRDYVHWLGGDWNAFCYALAHAPHIANPAQSSPPSPPTPHHPSSPMLPSIVMVRAGRNNAWGENVVSWLSSFPTLRKHHVSQGNTHDSNDQSEGEAYKSVVVHTLARAGHWVHVDDPQGLGLVLQTEVRRAMRLNRLEI
eukprot:gene24360-29445_t